MRMYLSIRETAMLMGASEGFVRQGLKQGVFEWGYAVRARGGKNCTYYIVAPEFCHKFHIAPDQLDAMLGDTNKDFKGGEAIDD